MRPAIDYAILCDGDFPAKQEVRERLLTSDVVLCCDAAAESFMRFRRPEFVVGDMDSLSPELREEVADLLIREEGQEDNDLSKAFRWICAILRVGKAVRLPDFSITVYGATGKREDHTLGNISLLADFAAILKEASCDARITLVTDYGTFYPLLDSVCFELDKGQELSIFAFEPGLRIASSGLDYPTDGVNFDMWWKATLNRASGGTVRLAFSRPAKALLYLPGRHDALDIRAL